MLLRSKGLRVAVHPHSSLLAHMQIPNLVLHEQFVCQNKILHFFFNLQLSSNFKHICFVLYTAFAIILHNEHCLKKRKKTNFPHVVKNVHSDVVSNNLSEILFDLAHLCSANC